VACQHDESEIGEKEMDNRDRGTETPQQPLTAVQHVVMVLKLLGGAAVLGSLLWLGEQFVA
jgi:hypothetical protein